MGHRGFRINKRRVRDSFIMYMLWRKRACDPSRRSDAEIMILDTSPKGCMW